MHFGIVGHDDERLHHAFLAHPAQVQKSSDWQKKKGENTKMDKTKIIVVEDNIVYCEFVCNLLAREFRYGEGFEQASGESTFDKFFLAATARSGCYHYRDSP